MAVPQPANRLGGGAERLRDLARLRELHGLLQTLTIRDDSVGNQRAVSSALGEVARLAARAPHLSPSLRSRLGALGEAPVESVFRPALGMLLPEVSHLLAALSPGESLQPHFLDPGSALPPLRALSVCVGPTIGIGDELLLAAALGAHATPLRVSSRQSEAWTHFCDDCQVLGPPPHGGIDPLEQALPAGRVGEGLAFLDFLESDPSPEPLAPAGIEVAARWFMGSASGDVARPRDGVRHLLRYPHGMPQCRWLESLWMAARLVHGEALPRPHAARETPATRVLVQVSTSKRALMFPSDFYEHVFRGARNRLPQDVEIHVLNPPDDRTGRLAAHVARSLGALRVGRVELLPKVGVAEVIEHVQNASLLIGPDTFTAQSASLQGVPQVTLVLPEHLPWIMPGRPTLAVEAASEARALAAACTARLAFVLDESTTPLRARLRSAAARWLADLRAVEAGVVTHASGRRPRADLREPWERLSATYCELRHLAARALGMRYPETPPAFCRWSPFAYECEEEQARALARAYQSLAISDLSGMLLELA